MKLLVNILFFSLATFSVLTLFPRYTLAIEIRSSVEFQWEEDPKAAEYEVQISNQEGKVLKELKSKTTSFRVRMPVNKYKIRGRIKTKLGNYSPWSKDTDLLISPNKVKITNDKPQTRNLNANPKTLTTKTSVGWTPSPQAKKYIVKLKDPQGKVISEQEVDHPMCNFELKPGNYKYSITAVAPNGIISDEVESKETLQVNAAKIAKPKFVKTINENGRPRFVFEKVPGILIRGELLYANFLSETWTPVEKNDELKESLWEASFLVKPGRYKIYFWASAEGATDSEKIVEEFIVKPTEADLAVN